MTETSTQTRTRDCSKETRKDQTMKTTQTRLTKILAMGLIAGLLLSSTLLGHDLVPLNTISPVGGSTITTTETTLSGTFWNSGCGLGATIEVSATDGDVAAVTQSCNN